jgi:isopentenyl phosphate kinase
VLVHGAGGFGHVRAAEYELQAGLGSERQVQGTALVQRDVRDLNLRVLDALIAEGVPGVSLPAASWLELVDGRLLSFDAVPFQRAVARGLVPVTFGDVLMDTERGVAIASGDLLMAALAGALRPELSVFVTGVDGVYDGDPTDPSTTLLKQVSPGDAYAVGADAGGVADVTGAMGGKLREAFEVAASSGETWVIGGGRPGRLASLLSGGRVKGTRVLPDRR